jgi:sugar-specific transcriptional regulator TrmB
MSEQTDRLIALLTPYGLTKEEASLFLYLQENRGSTALAISRALKIARTKVYRILDGLLNQKLVTAYLSDRGQKFEAATGDQMSTIINQKEMEVNSLRKNLGELEQQLKLLGSSARQESKVCYYEGVEGLKQVTWNSLKAHDELLTMEIKDMDAFFSHEYAEDLRLRFVDNRIHIRTLTNAGRIPPWTDIATEMVKNYWEIRYIPKQQMDIKFEILIYNDVYAMYRYQDKKVFCVEIYNKELADMQHQIFDYMWQKAQTFKVLNDHGEAVVVRTRKNEVK